MWISSTLIAIAAANVVAVMSLVQQVKAERSSSAGDRIRSALAVVHAVVALTAACLAVTHWYVTPVSIAAALTLIPVTVMSLLVSNRSVYQWLFDRMLRSSAELDTACSVFTSKHPECEHILQEFIDAVPSPIFYKDLEGRYLGCNRAFEEGLGLSHTDIIGKTIHDLPFIQPRTIHMERDDVLRVRGGSQIYQTPLVFPDGTAHDVVLHKAMFSDEAHKPAGIVGVLVDVTSVRWSATQLRRSYELLDTIIEILPHPLFVKNAEHRWTLLNTAFCELLGRPREELLGRSDFDIFSESEAREFWRVDREALSSDKPIDNEESFTDASGRRHIIVARKQSFEGPDNNRMLVGVITDITEPKRMVEELRQATRVWQDTFDSISEAITVHDKDGKVLRANKAAARLTGIDSGRLIGMACCEVYQCLRDDAYCRRGECPKDQVGGTVQLHRKDQDRYFEISASPRWGIHGQPDGYIHIVRETTEAVRRNAQMVRLSAAVEQSANMVVITDPDAVIEYVNPTFSRITGYSAEQAVGKTMRLLNSGENDHQVYEDLWRTISAGETWSGTLRNRRASGELFWERQVITPIRDEHGCVINYLAIKEDITHEVETQQKLVESEKMATVGTLAAGVAHEFKNYLGGIIGNASYALDELEQTTDIELARSTLEAIISMGDRANDVAMSLLTYSKAKSEFSEEDLRALVHNTIGLVEQEMRSRFIHLATYFEEVPMVQMAPGRIQQLLLNLLINAAQAIDRDGVITVTVRSHESFVELSVGDSGCGIATDEQSRVFDPFFSTKGVWNMSGGTATGTGLGLAISRNIALEHGGDLTCRSISGLGTTFTLVLPVNGSAGPHRIHDDGHHPRVLLFTLDKNLYSHYFKDAKKASAELLAADNSDTLVHRLPQVADLVVCDAAFPGKIELSRVVDMCRKIDMPCVVVNLAGLEYQVSGIIEGTAARFAKVPDLNHLIEYSCRPSCVD